MSAEIDTKRGHLPSALLLTCLEEIEDMRLLAAVLSRSNQVFWDTPLCRLANIYRLLLDKQSVKLDAARVTTVSVTICRSAPRNVLLESLEQAVNRRGCFGKFGRNLMQMTRF